MMGKPLKILMPVIFLALLPFSAPAAPGDVEKGKQIYEQRCWWCHGAEGEGNGPAAEFLIPPPRDFTQGLYKFKSTPFDEIVPSDDDIFKMIKGGVVKNNRSNWTGLNDTSMPGWGDMLSDQDIWDLVAFIKAIVEFEQPEQPPISFANIIASSEASIAQGKEVFKNVCAECHGEKGLGDGTKSLKDDFGFRTWPRNLTKPWTFRMTDGAEGIFTRVSVGILSTQMPSFADPVSKKKLSEEERWHVANYVASLDAPYKKPGDNTVIKALRVEEEPPSDPGDALWDGAEYTSFYMVPQIIAKERFFTPSLNSISVKAIYNERNIALLLEWDDRTKSIPGDEKAMEVAGGEVLKDAVNVQFPAQLATTGTDKPFFGMGDAKHPVNVWNWKSESTQEGQSLALLDAKGFEDMNTRDASKSGLAAKGVYDNGTWRVVIKRALATKEKDLDLQFVEGQFIPIAFSAWDGSNGEEGSKFVMTTWYWLFLKPPTGATLFLLPLFFGLMVLGGELLLLRSFRKNAKKESD